MRELSRKPPEGQLWFTRAQARALAATAAAAAVLTFFLGLMFGRQGGASAEAAPPVTGGALIDDAVRGDTLPELLARVEAAADRNADRAHRLSFPEDLPADEPSSLLPPPQPEDLPDPAIASPPLGGGPEPPAAADGVPDQGWAVEVGAYRDAAAADEQVASLREQGHSAWRVESFEQGATRFRVRVGTWETKAAAAEALGELRESLGRDELFVTGVR